MWALGAIIHLLAIGKPPVRDIEKYKAEVIYEGRGKEPSNYDPQNGSGYWKQRVPREVTRINISVDDQRFRRGNDCKLHAVYSDTLNIWILRALSTKEKYRITSDQTSKTHDSGWRRDI